MDTLTLQNDHPIESSSFTEKTIKQIRRVPSPVLYFVCSMFVLSINVAGAVTLHTIWGN